jgi:hypothetical protein
MEFLLEKTTQKYFRETALTTADCMIERVADEMAWKDWAGTDGAGRLSFRTGTTNAGSSTESGMCPTGQRSNHGSNR